MRREDLNPHLQSFLTKDDVMEMQLEIRESILSDFNNSSSESFQNELKETQEILKENEIAFYDAIENSLTDFSYKDYALVILRDLALIEELTIAIEQKIKWEARLAEIKKEKELEQKRKEQQEIFAKIEEQKKQSEQQRKLKTKQPKQLENNNALDSYQKKLAKDTSKLLKHINDALSQFNQIFDEITLNIKVVNVNALSDEHFKICFMPAQKYLHFTSKEREKLIKEIADLSTTELNNRIAMLQQVLKNPLDLKQAIKSSPDKLGRDPGLLIVENLFLHLYVKLIKEKLTAQKQPAKTQAEVEIITEGLKHFGTFKDKEKQNKPNEERPKDSYISQETLDM